MSTCISLSVSRSLFDQDAATIFPGQDPIVVERCLDTVVKAIHYLATSKPNACFLFDPAAFNEQCPLYALMFAQAVKQDPRIESRFLPLCFFLSYPLLTNLKLMEQVVEKCLMEMGEGAMSRELRVFLKSSASASARTAAAREAFNRVFKEYLHRVLAEDGREELSLIAAEDLRHTRSDGKGTLYTYPKFAGVVYLLDAIAHEAIPLIFKVRVIGKEGVGFFSVGNLEGVADRMPVIVFEMVATDETLSYSQFYQNAKRCSLYFHRNLGARQRHPQTETCLLCAPSSVDVSLFERKFTPLLDKQMEQMILSCGADFINEHQASFVSFFQNTTKHPVLSQLFQKSVERIREFAISAHAPSSITVSHVYTDCAAGARERRMILDTRAETELQSRGLV